MGAIPVGANSFAEQDEVLPLSRSVQGFVFLDFPQAKRDPPKRVSFSPPEGSGQFVEALGDNGDAQALKKEPLRRVFFFLCVLAHLPWVRPRPA